HTAFEQALVERARRPPAIDQHEVGERREDPRARAADLGGVALDRATSELRATCSVSSSAAIAPTIARLPTWNVRPTRPSTSITCLSATAKPTRSPARP